MQLANALPNMSILKSPSNWFLVAFSMVLLVLIYHVVFKNRNKA